MPLRLEHRPSSACGRDAGSRFQTGGAALARVELRRLPAAQLTEVPVGVHQREVGERHVAPDALHLLRVPEGEGVVVARRDEDAVGFDRLEHVDGEVARQRLVRAAGRDPVADQRDERQRKHRAGGEPSAPRRSPLSRKPSAMPCISAPRPSGDEHAEDGERADEEVVALAHLARQVGLVGVLGEAVLEVQVEDERQRQRAQEREGGDTRPPVALPERPEAAQAERGEDGRRDARDSGPSRARTASEVLPEVGELADEGWPGDPSAAACRTAPG